MVLHESTRIGAPGGATEASEEELVIAPVSEEIRVLEEYAGDPIDCAGPTPTVQNTDTISVDREPHVHVALALDLRRGALLPGASPEADGTSEIELGGILGRHGFLFFDLAPVSDDVRLGIVDGGTAVNLNAGAEAGPDADVVTDRGSTVGIFARAGADRVSTRAQGAFDAPWRAPVIIYGGSGRDTLVGGRRRDIIVGMGGRDRLRGRGGPDLVDGSDKRRDRIDCGAGGDVVDRSSEDRIRDCERVAGNRRID